MKKLMTLIAVVFSIAACKKENHEVIKTGLKLSLTATNTYDYDDIKVSFKSIEYQIISDSGNTWTQLPLIDTSADGFINMHTVLHGNITDLSNTEMPAGHIKNLRIKFAPKAYISKNGVSYPLTIPANLLDNGIVVSADYKVVAGKTQSVVLVYNTNKSIVTTSSNSYSFQPDYRTFDPSVCGSIEGTVSPYSAMPSITVYANGANTFNETTIPYSDGYFKLVGVSVGKYNVRITTAKDGYTSQPIQNVDVLKGITSQFGTFTLKPQ